MSFPLFWFFCYRDVKNVAHTRIQCSSKECNPRNGNQVKYEWYRRGPHNYTISRLWILVEFVVIVRAKIYSPVASSYKESFHFPWKDFETGRRGNTRIYVIRWIKNEKRKKKYDVDVVYAFEKLINTSHLGWNAHIFLTRFYLCVLWCTPWQFFLDFKGFPDTYLLMSRCCRIMQYFVT